MVKVLLDQVVENDPTFASNRDTLPSQLLLSQLTETCGDGKENAARHRKLPPHERDQVLLDPDSTLMKLSPSARWDTRFALDGSTLTRIDVVSGWNQCRSRRVNDPGRRIQPLRPAHNAPSDGPR